VLKVATFLSTSRLSSHVNRLSRSSSMNVIRFRKRYTEYESKDWRSFHVSYSEICAVVSAHHCDISVRLKQQGRKLGTKEKMNLITSSYSHLQATYTVRYPLLQFSASTSLQRHTACMCNTACRNLVLLCPGKPGEFGCN
jgi:hypothetical protein